MPAVEGVISAMQGVFDIAKERVDPKEGEVLDTFFATPGHEDFMIQSGFIQPLKGSQAIRDDMAAGFDLLLTQCLTCCLRKPFTLCIFIRTGRPSSVVSADDKKGVLFSLPRPRLPACSPPQ